MATSFICEHSAEFSLVPQMKMLLEECYNIVVPIYPWLSREFGGKSKRIHGDIKFKVLVLFPRRPKTSSENRLYFTINSELKAFWVVGTEYGIPVIAGCPNAINFWDLSYSKDPIWINIDHPDTSEYLVPVDSLKSGRNMPRLNDEDIINLVEKSDYHHIERLENFVREARYALPSSFLGGRYKPVFFLIKSH